MYDYEIHHEKYSPNWTELDRQATLINDKHPIAHSEHQSFKFFLRTIVGYVIRTN